MPEIALDYMEYAIYQSERHAALYLGKSDEDMPITQKVKAAGIDPDHLYNQVMDHGPEFRMVTLIGPEDKIYEYDPGAEYVEDGQEVTPPPHPVEVGLKDFPMRTYPLQIYNTYDQEVQKIKWNPKEYKMLSVSDNDGELILVKKRGEG